MTGLQFSRTCVRLAVVSIFTFTFSVLFAASENPNVSARYANARIANQIASALHSRIIPIDVKSVLLDSPRSEDKEAAKSAVINWKRFSDTNAFADFDELIVLDDDGTEILRMRSDEGSDSFTINGKEWTAPESGSIFKSLRTHLAKQADQTSEASLLMPRFLLATMTAAFAGDGNKDAALTPAYLFANAVAKRKRSVASIRTIEQPASTTEALNEKPPDKYLAHEDSLLGYLKALGAVEVQCSAGVASGSVKLWHDRFTFESKSNGTVIFTLDDGAKTKLLVTARRVDNRKWAANHQAALDLILKTKPMSNAAAKSIFRDFFLNAKEINLSDRAYRQTAALLREDMPRLVQNGSYAEIVKKNADVLRQFYNARSRSIVTEEMSVAKCAKPDCSTVESGNERETIQPWLSRDDQQHIVNALKWKPSDSPAGSAKIVRTETAGAPIFTLEQGAKKLSESDMRTAQRLIEDARRAAERSSNAVRSMMLSLRPLGACCLEKQCREELARRNINLTPNGSKAVKK